MERILKTQLSRAPTICLLFRISILLPRHYRIFNFYTSLIFVFDGSFIDSRLSAGAVVPKANKGGDYLVKKVTGIKKGKMESMFFIRPDVTEGSVCVCLLKAEEI